MSPLYNTGIFLYRAAAKIVALRSHKVRTMLRGQKSTLKSLEQSAPSGGFDIWFHAASLGEFEQARPLIEKIKSSRPAAKILLSFFSPSGFEVRKSYDLADMVVYLPFDTPKMVKRFLDAAKPRKAVFVKYEFWGNFLDELKHRDIPVYLISAIFRKNQRFFKKGNEMFRGMLFDFEKIYVQDTESRKLLNSVGYNSVEVAGDTRFDRVSDIMHNSESVPGLGEFVKDNPFTWVFGSSWPADESVYSPWLKSHPEVKAIIAPHEFDASRLHSLVNELGPTVTMLYSRYQELAEIDIREATRSISSCRYLIIDCFGLLGRAYRYGNAAYVGGGFGAGIHNINEAAVYGIPVVFGPKYEKFKEARDLISEGGAFSISSRADFCQTADLFLKSHDALLHAGRKCSGYIERNLGATDLIISDIMPEINH